MRPLAGTLVVSLEQAVAAPFATRQLADLGARVIKVERPDGGDFARGYDTTVRGLSSHFVWLNRSKQSIALDLKSDLGRRAMAALAAKADVFVQNLAPGSAERLGLDAATLRTQHPRLIHASISGYGVGGPRSQRKAYDLLVQCEAGLVSITGTPASPAKVGIAVADIAAGMYTYAGILTALLRRHQTGIGATLDISMLEALAEWMGFPMYFSTYGGGDPARTGVSHATIAPYGPVSCDHGQQVFLGVQNEREWIALCNGVLQMPELARDTRFADNARRVANRQLLDQVISPALARLDASEVERRLDAAGIANARLRRVSELTDNDQLIARGRWRQVDSPVGPLAALLPPATLDGDEPVLNPVPAVGEHTSQILAELRLATDLQ